MDLNYLFHRQQVERSRARAARSEQARIAHEQLARCYEVQIEQLTAEGFTFTDGIEQRPARADPSARSGPRTNV